MTGTLPTRAQIKAQAKRLRAAQTTPISQAQALERIAHQHGFRDWNTLSAAIDAAATPAWTPGDRVTGRYLSQPFTATILAVETAEPGWYRLVLDLDEAVDVVRFESFSNLRKQVRVTVGPKGHTAERTSDGVPHMVLDL